MLQEINTEEIAYAEQLLFGSTGHFDAERLAFINCLKTTDLQAVPGSGKTTVLLAKLLILEKRLPLSNGSGLLILSHTNIAIDEIRERIGAHCPKLFCYPNFVGTIQSFVNQFLAIPFYENHFGKKLFRIDNEVYDEEINRSLLHCLKDASYDAYKKVLHIRNTNADFIRNYRFDIPEKTVVLLHHLNGDQLEVSKPRGNTKKENYKDYTAAEKQEVITYLTELKSTCLKAGTLHFDDAYFLAKLYLKQKPRVATYIRQRFPYVFVDEMQDMEIHQCKLLEQLFYDDTSGICYQRIGDINQCIFNEDSGTLENIWQERPGSLTIAGSHRLTPAVASMVQNFGAKKFVPITGLNKNTNIKPHILLFNPALISMVIPLFGDLVLNYQSAGKIPKCSKYPVRVIGWNGKQPEPGKLRIKDYYPAYQATAAHQKIDFLSLYSYLVHYDKEKLTLESIRKNVLNAILKVMRIDDIRNGERHFRISTFMAHVKMNFPEMHSLLLDVLYYSCINTIRGDTKSAHDKLCDFIPKMAYTIFQHTLSEEVLDFLNTKEPLAPAQPVAIPNRIIHKALDISVGTVHSVKGETHLATLYLDTCYFKHESEKSVNQLLGKDAAKETKSRIQDSAKMMYVGLSRATHLVCYAVSQDHLGFKEDELTAAGWEIIRI